MNYARQQDKPFRMMGAFVAAMVVLTLAGAAIPSQAQTYKVIYNFGTKSNDPVNLYYAGLFPQGWDGKLYGVWSGGGPSGDGAVFSITLAGTPDVLQFFDGTDGRYDYYGLTLGSDGNFYGVTTQGGTSNDGTAFKVTPTGTLTVLHNFTGGADGGGPYAPPVQGNDGNFYGVTTGIIGGVQTDPSTFYKVTPSGTFTTVHTLTTAEGLQCVHTTLGSDGNFYASCNFGGANSEGTLFKISATGHLTVLHNVTAATDGQVPNHAVQAKDGNFYGAMYEGGANSAGTIFQLKASGTYTVLHSFTGGTDGGTPYTGSTQGPDGNLYGVTNYGGNAGACNGGCGVIYKITTTGSYSVLYTFDNTHGAYPESELTLDTDGVFYGNTGNGGTYRIGVFYSLNVGFSPFISLVTTSGKVGSKVGILGQGFSSASVVKFGGVQATSFTRKETTYISATVPAGAIDGKVTVTTGSTTLASPQTFIVHNSWRSGAALPTARMGAAAGAIGTDIYVVGGYTLNGAIGNNDIYNPAKNTWTSGAADPNPRAFAAYAVVNKKLYIFGGSNGSALLSVAEAYDPATNTWSTLAPVPYVQESASAVADKDVIYVIGGQNITNYLTTVETYNTTTNTWTEEAPMLLAKGWSALGLLGTTVVAADGSNSSTYLGDNEGYNATNNTWSELTPDPTPRNPGCYGAINGKLYVAGGTTPTAITLNEAYNPGKNAWATLAPMPQAPGIAAGSAVDGGNLYCFGGGIFLTNVYDYTQIYQP